MTFDAIVVGGGPAGATAAADLAGFGRSVLLLDRGGRIKPCGGAIPPRLVRDFDIADEQIVARVRNARMVSPTNVQVDMPMESGYVGMVDREHFDEWLRTRAVEKGAERRAGFFERVTHDPDGVAVVEYYTKGADGERVAGRARGRVVVGADGAKSAVAKQCVKGADRVPYVFAYHEILRAPAAATDELGRAFEPGRADIFYNGKLSPDFYGWVFPHGDTVSVGSGSAKKGFSIRGSVTELRGIAGLKDATTIRREGAPIPMKPMKRWDNGRDVVLAGDAAGVVAPASGEGIYYAMEGGRLAAQAVEKLCATGDVRALREPRRRFMKAHGQVFLVLGIMQWFWYSSDKRRESFVAMCRDEDVQKMTWDSYMNKKLTRKDPLAQLKIFFKDTAHLLGILSPADPTKHATLSKQA
jgi:geranylgeranyl reductase